MFGFLDRGPMCTMFPRVLSVQEPLVPNLLAFADALPFDGLILTIRGVSYESSDEAAGFRSFRANVSRKDCSSLLAWKSRAGTFPQVCPGRHSF